MISAHHLSLVFASAMLGGCAGPEARSIESCTEKLRTNLVAPSTLKVVWSGHSEAGPITREEMLQKLKDDVADQEARFRELSEADRFYLAMQKKDLKEDPNRLLKYFSPEENRRTIAILLEYDAENRMGVPLRSFFMCRVRPAEDSNSQPWVFTSGSVPTAEGRSLKSMMTDA